MKETLLQHELMQNKPTTIEDVVEKLAMALTHGELGIYARNEKFVRNIIQAILQSQAEQNEREKRELVMEIHDFLLGYCGKKDCLRGQCQTVHIRRNAWKEIKTIAQKYGVDTQSQTGS
jgi:hypothetical protein